MSFKEFILDETLSKVRKELTDITDDLKKKKKKKTEPKHIADRLKKALTRDDDQKNDTMIQNYLSQNAILKHATYDPLL